MTFLGIWPYRNINIRIYSGTVDKWHNIVVTSLLWHMTSLGLYFGPDSTMQAVQKSTNARFADYLPVRPLHSSNLCCLDLCCDSLSPQGGDGGTVYPPVVLASFPQFYSIHKRPLMYRLVCDDRFSVIFLYFHTNLLKINYAPIPVFSPCSYAILAHCINQTNATSGLDPVAFFKMSLRFNQWLKSNKNQQN